VKRAGGWTLGVLVITAMAGGGWFALRKVLFSPTVVVVLMRDDHAHTVPADALFRGAAFALQEREGRAGKFKVRLVEGAPDETENPRTAAWIGSSESINLKINYAPISFSAYEVIPWEHGGYFITPGAARIGSDAATWIQRKFGPRVALITDRDVQAGHFISKGFITAAKDLNLEIVREGEAAHKDLVGEILQSRPDAVFYTGEQAPYGTTFKLFSALRLNGFKGALVAGDADPAVSFLATRPDLVEGSFLISPFAPAPADLAARMGIVPGPHVTAGYFAMKTALETLDQADSIEQDDLFKAIQKLGSFGPNDRPLRPGAVYVARNGLFQFVEELK
jgi:hypothetical protein